MSMATINGYEVIQGTSGAPKEVPKEQELGPLQKEFRKIFSGGETPKEVPKDPWHSTRLGPSTFKTHRIGDEFPVERDPNGKPLNEPGAKADANKPLAGVLHDFALALQSVALVGSYGAKKYSRGGWQQVPDASTRYFDAMWRHLLASRHEEIDPESGLSHFAAVCWNVLAIEELNQRAKL